MEHIMKLYEDSFNKIKTGMKKREYRLYDEKRQKIKVGDTIKFLKLPNLKEEIIVKVTNIEKFSNWYECYAKYFIEDFKERYNTIEDVVKDTTYYTKEETKKYGCVIFTIKLNKE